MLMRRLEKHAVYGGTFGEDIVGFRCSECGKVVPSMLGDTCSACWNAERRHREMVRAIESNDQAHFSEVSDSERRIK